MKRLLALLVILLSVDCRAAIWGISARIIDPTSSTNMFVFQDVNGGTIPLQGWQIGTRIPMKWLVFDTNAPRLEGMFLQLDENGAAKFDYITNSSEWQATIGGIQAQLNPACLTNSIIVSNTASRVYLTNGFNYPPVIPANALQPGFQGHYWGIGDIIMGSSGSSKDLSVMVHFGSAVIASNSIARADLANQDTSIIYEIFLTVRAVTNQVAIIIVDGSIKLNNSLLVSPKEVDFAIPEHLAYVSNSTSIISCGSLQWLGLPPAGDYVVVRQGLSK